MSEGRFTVTVGVAGSGKSTYARNHWKDALWLESDRFREAIFGGRRPYHDAYDVSPQIAAALKSLLRDLMLGTMQAILRVGVRQDVILSDTCLDWDAVEPFWNLARERRMEIVVVYFDASWATLVQRNQTRETEHRIPDGILEAQYARCQGRAGAQRWWLDPSRADSLIRIGDDPAAASRR
jgi:predicted kinase